MHPYTHAFFKNKSPPPPQVDLNTFKGVNRLDKVVTKIRYRQKVLSSDIIVLKIDALCINFASICVNFTGCVDESCWFIVRPASSQRSAGEKVSYWLAI